MGFYQRSVAPRVISWTCASRALTGVRTDLLAGLRGTVLELGFGAGANVGAYPADVARIWALEPSDAMWAQTPEAVRADSRLRRLAAVAEQVPLEEHSVDAVVCTFTLCSVASPSRVLAEAFRVVRPGGQLRLLEHGVAPGRLVSTMQWRLDAVEQRLADGCHLTRDPEALVRDSAWVIDRRAASFYGVKSPWTYLTTMHAIRPAVG